jgi:hypothetical protein
LAVAASRLPGREPLGIFASFSLLLQYYSL